MVVYKVYVGVATASVAAAGVELVPVSCTPHHLANGCRLLLWLGCCLAMLRVVIVGMGLCLVCLAFRSICWWGRLLLRSPLRSLLGSVLLILIAIPHRLRDRASQS